LTLPDIAIAGVVLGSLRMPLYEGIGLTEKQAVVIDIGAAYTK
jgi:hypothetical protein